MDSFQSNSVAKGLEDRRGEGFDAMGQRVQAGRGGEFRRKIDGHFRVEDDELGQQPGQENDRSALSARQGNDRATPNLAAGAGGGRDADTTSQPAPIVVEIELAQLEFGTLHEQAAS